MSTFAFIHGAGDVGWYWHLVEAELRTRGHDTVAPDLPADDDAATLTDYADAVADAVGDRKDVVVVASRDGGLTGNDDPYVTYYHDVPRELAEEAVSKERAHPSEASMNAPWPLPAWPDVPTRFLLSTEDRFFPPDFLRRLVRERLTIVPDEIAAGHCVALARPKELADLLAGYAADPGGPD